MTLPNMNDTGERRQFETGAVRDASKDKPRPDLISPHANLREGAWMARGADKYEERNWEKGIPISACIASLERHLCAYKLGMTDEDHLAAIRTNASFILHYEEEIKAGRLPGNLDDMPKYTVQKHDAWRQAPDTPKNRDFTAKAQTTLKAMPRSTSPDVIESPLRLCQNWWDCVSCTLFSGCPSNQCIRSTFYISGPMRGYPDYNFPAFDAACSRGRTLGYNIISPADMDRVESFCPKTMPLTDADLLATIKRDTAAIIALDPAKGDGVAVLSGWTKSIGASAEVALAHWRGLRIVLAKDFTTEVKVWPPRSFI